MYASSYRCHSSEGGPQISSYPLSLFLLFNGPLLGPDAGVVVTFVVVVPLILAAFRVMRARGCRPVLLPLSLFVLGPEIT